MHFVVIVGNQILAFFENIGNIFCGKIWIMKIKLSLTNFDGCNIITQKCFAYVQIWLVHGLFPTQAIYKKEIWINSYHKKNSKLTLATIKDALSFAIYIINGIYIEITRFAGLNMVIQRVLTFCKILLPFAFIRSTSFKIQCAFSSCEKEMNKRIEASPICIWQ